MSKQLTTYLTRAQKFSLTGLLLLTSVIFPSLILFIADLGFPLQHSFFYYLPCRFPFLLSLPLLLGFYVNRLNCKESAVTLTFKV